MSIAVDHGGTGSGNSDRTGEATERVSAAITGWGRLARLHLRTARWWLLAWLLIPSGVVVATGHSIAALYDDVLTRLSYAGTMEAAPGSIAINGRWRDLETVGGIVTNEVGLLGLLVFPLAGILLAVRLTRREEDAGRIDLLSAGRLGRLAPPVAAGLVCVGVAASGAVIMGAGLWAAGLPTVGAVRYATLLSLSMILWAGVGLLAAQVARDARTAITISLGVLLVAYLVRMVVDGIGAPAEWLSPMGWLPVAAPFGSWRWEPYLAVAALAIGLFVAAAGVAARRDLDGGLIAPRPGPDRGHRRSGTPMGLAWRVVRPSMVGWVIGLSAWSIGIGLLAGEMTAVMRGNPQLVALFGLDSPEDAVVAMTAALTALGLAAMGVQGIARLGIEEDAGRLGLVLSGAVVARRMWASWTAVAVGSVVVTAALQAGLFAVASIVSTDRTTGAIAITNAASVLAIPVVVVILVAAGLRAGAPRGSALPWLLVVWGAVVAFLAEALRLPEWARDLSVFHVVGQVPIVDPDLAAIAALTVIGVVAVVAGRVAVGRRDLTC